MSPEAVVAGKEILTEAGARPDDGLLSISPPWEGAVLGVRLKGLWADQPFAAMAGDFRGKRLLSHERLRLSGELIKAFRDAHDHAVDLRRDRQLLRFRETFERITREIVEALGSQILDVDGVLRSAATGLRSLGYKRVFFSLVDPGELHINGVWDESDDPQINLPGMSKWPLAKPTADVQSFVVSTKQYLLIEDARQHYLTLLVSAQTSSTPGNRTPGRRSTASRCKAGRARL